MTLLYIDGFDNGDFGSLWALTTGGTHIVADTDTPFSVGKCLSRGTIGGGSSDSIKRQITASATVYFGFWFRLDTASTTTAQIIQVFGDTGATAHTGLLINSSTKLISLFRGTTATILATGTTVLNVGAWYFIEWQVTVADSGGLGVVKINGATDINFSGDTKNAGTSTNIDAVSLFSTASSQPAIRLDDLYVLNGLDDGVGPANNTFLGQRRVQTLNPNAAGNDTGLTPTGSANNYANVSDQNAATYNASSVSGTRDTYALPDVVAGTGAIDGIQTVIQAVNSDAGAGSIKPVVRSGGTNYYDPTITLSASAMFSVAVREVDPATSAQWTASGVNALQIGAEVA